VLLMPVVPVCSNLGFFLLAALGLLLAPGPAVLYIVTRSIDQGRRAGLVSVLGVHVGTLAQPLRRPGSDGGTLQPAAEVTRPAIRALGPRRNRAAAEGLIV
jgi:hypothetical protein